VSNDIIDAFFDLFDKYLELQYAIEVCRPHFSSSNGRLMIDDLLRLSMFYSAAGDRLLGEYADILTSESSVNMMANRIAALAKRIECIQWSENSNAYDRTADKEFSSYVTDALISPNEHDFGEDGREWFVEHNMSANNKELICRTVNSKEWNGVYIEFNGDKSERIGYYINDTPVLLMYVNDDGLWSSLHRNDPVELNVAIEGYDGPHNIKNVESAVSWVAVLAGVAGGALLSAMLKSKDNVDRSKTTSSEEKLTQVKHAI